MPETDHVSVAGAAEQQSGYGMQAIEPAPGLIHGLADEVSGETQVETGLVLERIVPLSQWHGSGIKPAVNHLGHSLHPTNAFWA